MITKRSISKPDSKKEAWRNRDKANDDITSSHCSRPLSSSQTTTRPDRTRPAARKADGVPPGASGKPHAPKTDAGGGPGTQKHIRTAPRKAPRTREANDLFHTSTPTPNPGTIPGTRATRRTPDRRPEKLRRKEVIQPHLPVRLPCYDLVPITSLTLDGSIPQGVRPPASGATHFHDLTAGVPCPGRCLGAWWFENWIVDASNAMTDVIVCFIAISPGSIFWSLVSRSIVL